MPWNILLLPLVGGYSALHFCYYTKFRAHRLEGHRLLLESALAAGALIVPARLILYLLKLTSSGQALQGVWIRVFGEIPYLATGALTLCLGLTFPIGLNLAAACLLRASGKGRRLRRPKLKDFLPKRSAPRFGPKWLRRMLKHVAKLLLGTIAWVGAIGSWLNQPARDHAQDWALLFNGDPVQRLLRRAMQSERPVMVTLKDRKVYVGLVWELPDLTNDAAFLSLLPVISGHRDEIDLRAVLHTAYPDYSNLDPELGVVAEDFLVSIPWSELQSAHLFDQSIYDRYFKRKPRV